MGLFTVFDWLRVRHDLAVMGKVEAPNIPMTVKGHIKYNTSGIATKASTGVTIPKGAIVTGVAVNVTTAFNAATTNELCFGYSADTDALIPAASITANAIGGYGVVRHDAPLSGNSVVYAQYTQTGTAATAGEADVYVTYVMQ